ncbi:high mobility group box domain-containing protein, partial [Dichotomocladium elegans]
MSGFLFFLAAVRPRVAQQFPGSTVGPISKVIAAQWRDMSIEERIPWLQKADEDKARYAREMQAY